MTQKANWNGTVTPLRTVSTAPYSATIFPPNPSVGDQFTSPYGITYQWDGTVWFTVGATGGASPNVPIGSTPPQGAVPGQLWWRNDPDNNLYILYNDGTSTQWVPASSLLSGGGGIGDAPSDGNTYARQNGAWIEVPDEAPQDGNMYVRQNGAWVQIAVPFADAPSDGTVYGRSDATWVNVP